jgi:hypothetical protein
VGVGVAFTFAVGSCSGDGEGATTTTAATTTTSTAAPTTTLDPLAAEEAAVSHAAEQARFSRTRAFINLDDPVAIAELDLYYVPDGPARA